MKKRRAAFTLVELLLSITLLVVITTVTYTCFTSAIRAWRVGSETADSLNHGDFIVDQITKGLRSAYYPDVDSPSPKYGMIITDNGEEADAKDEISWVKLGTALIGSDSKLVDTPHRIVLTVLDDNEAQRLDLPSGGLAVKAWRVYAQPEDFNPDEDETIETMLISPDVVGLDIYALNPDDNLAKGKNPVRDEEFNDDLEWEPEWIDQDWTNRIPYAVEVFAYMRGADEDAAPVPIGTIATIPCAPLSWRDHGAAGGSSRSANSRDRRNNGQNAGGSDGARRNGSGGVPPPNGDPRRGPQPNGGGSGGRPEPE